jgi:hypothetical protein
LRGEIGRGSRDTQDHELLIGDEHMICLRTLGIRGAQEKSAAKKRMGGVGDFDLDVRRLGHGRWVVERGIKVCARSITSDMPR